MTTAIIGLGNIGKAVARHLVDGGERVVLAARDESDATALANELGALASGTSVDQAITDADVVVFAVWLDTLKELVAQHADQLRGKVVVDPSNPAAQDGLHRVEPGHRDEPLDRGGSLVVIGRVEEHRAWGPVGRRGQ
jgi:8-hydroxy-5-deazaflavin:NADPH oxidoreductase